MQDNHSISSDNSVPLKQGLLLLHTGKAKLPVFCEVIYIWNKMSIVQLESSSDSW